MHDIEGKISTEEEEEAFLRSSLQNEDNARDDGRLIGESYNQGLNVFNPDIMFENLVNNYSMAKKVYGETLVRLLSGYNSSYLERNIKIPEFKRELKKKLQEKIDELKEKKILKRDNTVSEKGLALASFVLFTQELDQLEAKGMLGEKTHNHPSHYGERVDRRAYHKGDRYKDIDVKQSVKIALRRGHPQLEISDLRSATRQSKGTIDIIYALDASGSMKGKKLEVSKKAGVALAYKAIQKKDKVGLLVFGSEIKEEIAPTDDFPLLLRKITQIMASRQTDFKGMLRKSLELFPKHPGSKHLLILTDAMPTVGDDPEKEAFQEVGRLASAGITVSLIGINLDETVKTFAEKLVGIGQGRLYLVRESEELDKIVLEDYLAAK